MKKLARVYIGKELLPLTFRAKRLSKLADLLPCSFHILSPTIDFSSSPFTSAMDLIADYYSSSEDEKVKLEQPKKKIKVEAAPAVATEVRLMLPDDY